jgi:hypothetical protein
MIDQPTLWDGPVDSRLASDSGHGRERARVRRFDQREYNKLRMRAYRATPEGKAATRAAIARHKATPKWRATHAAYSREHAYQAAARNAVRIALHSGRLTKPRTCARL